MYDNDNDSRETKWSTDGRIKTSAVFQGDATTYVAERTQAAGECFGFPLW